MSTTASAENNQLRAVNKLFVVGCLFMSGAMYGLWMGKDVVSKKIQALPIEGQITAAPIEAAPTYTIDQIALLISKTPGIKDATKTGSMPSNFEDVFSPSLVSRQVEAVQKSFILPPVDVVAEAPPPEDLKRVFKEAFLLDSVSMTGAFFNQRFIPVGGVIYEGKSPGLQSDMKALLLSADPNGANVTVNGDFVRIDFVRPKDESGPVG